MSTPPDLHAIERRAMVPTADLKKLSARQQAELLLTRSETVITKSELEQRLTKAKRTKTPLRIKYGIDPTRPEVHVGHAVPIRVLRLFQRMGHKVIFIIGDFTAMIGDPSGRIKERPVLTKQEVMRNVRSYEKQAALLLDMHKTEVRFNSDWFGSMQIAELFEYLRLQTVAQAMEREDFRTRASVTRAELLYATLQAIDSVEVEADIEVGAVDQLLNLHEGRELMSRLNLTPQTVFTTPLLPGLGGTGKKMSKSEGNYIALTDDATQVYGKVMTVADKDLLTYFTLLTDVPPRDLKTLTQALATRSVNPKEIKQLLARLVTKLIHPDVAEVTKAEQAFERTFSQGEAPKKVPHVTLTRSRVKDLADLLVLTKMVSSRSEAKRLIDARAVSIVAGRTRDTVRSLDQLPDSGSEILQVGKRKFVRVTLH